MTTATSSRAAADALACVRATLSCASPGVFLLPHAVQLVNSFVDPLDQWTLERASMAGHASLLDRLAAREWAGASQCFRRGRFLYAVRRAAKQGNVDVFVWWMTKYALEDPRPEVVEITLRIAADEGHLDLLEWFFRDDQKLTMLDTMTTPLKCQHPELIRWILARNPNARLEITMNEAASQGDLEFLKWVHAQGKRFRYLYNWSAMDGAAKGGHLDVLKWL